MNAAKSRPGPWEPVSLLREAGESKARLVVRRIVWNGEVPESEYMPGTFVALEQARAAIAKAEGGAS